MLFLLFQLGPDRYALPANRVIEVLPLVDLKQIPDAPRGVAGMFNYRGRPVPAVDLSLMTLGRPAGAKFSTRIVVINYPDENGRLHPLGLIAERATETIQRDAGEFVEPGLKTGAPYLGPVLMDSRGLVQWVHEERLLPDKARDLLFCDTVEQERLT
jgi:chemotaxis-related protein WspB